MNLKDEKHWSGVKSSAPVTQIKLPRRPSKLGWMRSENVSGYKMTILHKIVSCWVAAATSGPDILEFGTLLKICNTLAPSLGVERAVSLLRLGG